MPILVSDLRWYGSASMPDSDTPTAIGGAMDASKVFEFVDLNADGTVQAVSSAVGDTTQTVTVHYRNAAGTLTSEVKTLTGQTPVAFIATMRTLMKALKSATCAGDVAVEASTAERTGTAQGAGGETNTIQLDASASGTDGYYNGMAIRITGGAGINQIARIISYKGSTKTAWVSKVWGTAVDATSVFRISRGMVFEKSPTETMEVRRIFYDAAADDPLGSTRNYYEKVFIKNTHGTLTLSAAQVIESSDPSGKVTFGVAATLDDTGTNGVGNNRQVAPSGITFDSATKNMTGSALGAGLAQGVWLKLTLAPGDLATKTTYVPQASGSSPS